MKLKIYLWKLFSQKWKLLNFLVLIIFSGLLSSSVVSGVLGQDVSNQINLVYPSGEISQGEKFNVEVKIPDGASLEKNSSVSAVINLNQLPQEAKINLNKDNYGNYPISNDKIEGVFSVGRNGQLIFGGRARKKIIGVPGDRTLFNIPMVSKDGKSINFSKSTNQPEMVSLNTTTGQNSQGQLQTVSLLGTNMNSQSNGSSGLAGNGSGNGNIGGGGSTAGSNSSNGLPQYGPESFAELICKITCFLQPIIITLAILMIILSGFQFVTAQGNEEKINQAKNTFKWTVIGVAIIIGAKLIIIILAEILGGGSFSCGC
ncbi:MAG TPA: hypothetical protein ENL06_00770 [Candidatus Portnoybacteria bacterium]|nr:hypothetical protein [Candidatus Portnoybacteria bacterium]